MIGRASAIITCPLCPWRAKHVADTVTEVAEWLARVLVEHTKEYHKEQQ